MNIRSFFSGESGNESSGKHIYDEPNQTKTNQNKPQSNLNEKLVRFFVWSAVSDAEHQMHVWPEVKYVPYIRSLVFEMLAHQNQDW